MPGAMPVWGLPFWIWNCGGYLAGVDRSGRGFNPRPAPSSTPDRHRPAPAGQLSGILLHPRGLGTMGNVIQFASAKPPERYRSGHNGADSKSDGRGNPARGFESRPLRHFPPPPPPPHPPTPTPPTRHPSFLFPLTPRHSPPTPTHPTHPTPPTPPPPPPTRPFPRASL